MTFSSLTSSKEREFGEAHIDVASSEKRLIRVTKNTYNINGINGITYINIKLFKKKDDQDKYGLQQRVGLTVKEFQEMVAKVENLIMGPTNPEHSIGESTTGLLNAISRLMILSSEKWSKRRNEMPYNSFEKKLQHTSLVMFLVLLSLYP